jgi:hypothetical protein
MCRSTDELDSKVSTPLPTPNSNESGVILSQALAPLQSITQVSPRMSRVAAATRARSPLPRFGPLQRLPSLAEPHTPNPDPSVLVTLHPQGFSPSRCLAPRATCRACFIPVPLLGSALRGLRPCTMPYAFSDAAPFMGFRLRPLKDSACPSKGRPHRAKLEPQVWGLARWLRRMPP